MSHPPSPSKPACIFQQQRYLILSKKVHNGSAFHLTCSHWAYTDYHGCPLPNPHLNTRFPWGAIAEHCQAPPKLSPHTHLPSHFVRAPPQNPLGRVLSHTLPFWACLRSHRPHPDPRWGCPSAPRLLPDRERQKFVLIHDRDFYFKPLSVVFSSGGVPKRAGLAHYPYSHHEHAPTDRPKCHHCGLSLGSVSPHRGLCHFMALLSEAKARESCLADAYHKARRGPKLTAQVLRITILLGLLMPNAL